MLPGCSRIVRLFTNRPNPIPMKPKQKHAATLALALLVSPGLRAQEPIPEIAGLEAAAANFILAYNAKDAAAVAALFAEDGEITDLLAEDITSGRAGIEARYAEIFAAEDVPSVAVEVDSVRLVAPTLAIEDGTVHYTPPGEDKPARSSSYTAVLTKGENGEWKIASTRGLGDASTPAGHLDDLAGDLKGDWTAQKGSLRVDFAFGWDETGNFLTGDMLTTDADAEPQTTSIRFGWDGAARAITCWTFDSGGGFAKARWTPTEDGWSVRTEGTTADGESMSTNQHLVVEGADTLIWSSTDRVIDGKAQPDRSLRIVRQAPEPSLE